MLVRAVWVEHVEISYDDDLSAVASNVLLCGKGYGRARALVGADDAVMGEIGRVESFITVKAGYTAARHCGPGSGDHIKKLACENDLSIGLEHHGMNAPRRCRSPGTVIGAVQ